jgi:hypothetical protein
MKLEKVDVVYKQTLDGKTYYPREKGVLIGKNTIVICGGNGIQVNHAEYSTLYRGYFIDLDIRNRKNLFEIASIAGVDDEDDMLELLANNPAAAEHLMALANMQWVKGAASDV